MYVIALFTENPNADPEAEPLCFLLGDNTYSDSYAEAKRFATVSAAFVTIEAEARFLKPFHTRVYHETCVPPWWGAGDDLSHQPKNGG